MKKGFWKSAVFAACGMLYYCGLMAEVIGLVGLLNVGWRQLAKVFGLPLNWLLAAASAAGLVWRVVEMLRQRYKPKREVTQHDA